MGKDEKIYVAGHRGLVGSAIVRALNDQGFTNIITRSRSELDLLDTKAVADFLQSKNCRVLLLHKGFAGRKE